MYIETRLKKGLNIMLELIINTIKKSKPAQENYDAYEYPLVLYQWKIIVENFANTLSVEIQDFNKPTFYDLCGYKR